MNQFENRNFLEINTSLIYENAKNIKKYIGDTQLMSVVKTDAYGLGMEMIASVISEVSDWFGVATAEEALCIRRQGIDKDILVLGYVMDEYIPLMTEEKITLTTVSVDYIKHISQLVPKGQTLDVHIKIDTGLNRIGLYSENHNTEDFLRQIKEIYALDNINITGIYTHFAVAGSPNIEDIKFTKHQYEVFLKVCDAAEREGYDLGVKHCCNSDAVVNYPEFYMDMVRVGKLFFGFGQNEVIKKLNIQLPFKLKGRIIRIKTILPEETVSYGRAFEATKKTKIATVSIGFGDGLRRNMYEDLNVLVNGQRSKVAGRLTMDSTMVDITNVENVNVGDYVTIIGQDNDEIIMPNEVAYIANASTPEINTVIHKRVPRIYVDKFQ